MSKMEASKAENLKIDSFNLDNFRKLDQTIVQIILCTKVQVFYKISRLLQTVVMLEK